MRMRLERAAFGCGILAGACAFTFDRMLESVGRPVDLWYWSLLFVLSFLAMGFAGWNTIGWFAGWWGQEHPKSPMHGRWVVRTATEFRLHQIQLRLL